MILHAAEAGQGAPVALLHGLFGRAQNLGVLARRLAARRRVLSIDLRNHGASAHAAGMAYATLAADVLETLADRGALPCAMLGHSMGGKAAMAAALASPEAIARLVVADIAPAAYAHHNRAVAAAMLAVPLDRPMTRAQAGAALADAVPDAGVRGFLLQNFLPGASPCWRIGLTEIAAGMADIEGWPEFAPARYEGPALFIRGGNSDYVLPAHENAIHALFADARIVTIDNAGHWLHADRAEEFCREVEDVLF